jgi:uncharacterized membrane protein YfhO
MEKVDFNPRESMLIRQEEYKNVPYDFHNAQDFSVGAFTGEAKILKYFPSHVEIETKGKNSSFLVLPDNFYPGWKVSVNGREETVLMVNYNLRGVAVPPGKNRIAFTFDPMSFKIGVSLTLITLLTCMCFLLPSRKGKDKITI